VVVDHRAELDLLDLDRLLPLARFRCFLLSGILVLPVVHDLADGRAGIRRNFDQIHADFLSHPDGEDGLDRAPVLTGLVDQLDLRIADIIIDARPVFAGSGRSFIRTANGWFSNVVKEAGILKEEALAGKQVARANVKNR
jgi:hypothetical protein